ncbi:ABC-three component system protein [Peptococcus simiae]|uniref:ABC-three component system protein n=1 Tax=Peptococcus simiae TaxID=1643805 RepID=UPI00397F6981
MKRKSYFDYIEGQLTLLAQRVAARNKINLLELNIHSETFFADFCNILFDLDLCNLNVHKQNVEGIDLVDRKNSIIAQVTSVGTKAKIESSLSKQILQNYSNYAFKFILLSADNHKTLKAKIFANPYGLIFKPSEDIWDMPYLLRNIESASIDKLENLYTLCRKELGQDIDCQKLDSNLVKLVNVLAQENFAECNKPHNINSFSIEDKISFNKLEQVKPIIDDYAIFSARLTEIYSEFDRDGHNKSFSVLQEIRRFYIQTISSDNNSPVSVFHDVCAKVIEVIQNSRNPIDIPLEELHVCVDIIVVDAFIRCKIFENPEGYSHVTTG